jgi:hypothetical protein
MRSIRPIVDMPRPRLTNFAPGRAREKRPDLRVLYATGFADLSGRDDPPGGDRRIKKPFHLAELAAEVRSAIAKAVAPAPLRG